MVKSNSFTIIVLVGGLEHELYDFPFSWECHNPNWRTHSIIFVQRGRSTTKQCFIRLDGKIKKGNLHIYIMVKTQQNIYIYLSI